MRKVRKTPPTARAVTDSIAAGGEAAGCGGEKMRLSFFLRNRSLALFTEHWIQDCYVLPVGYYLSRSAPEPAPAPTPLRRLNTRS